MADYEALADKKNELIRKGLEGSVFAAPMTADTVDETSLFAADGSLVQLPTGYGDVGWLTTDGAQFSNSVETSDVTSWGSNEPTRSDITADTTTLAFTMQETKALSIGLFTGIDTSKVRALASNGAVGLKKPSKASAAYWRFLTLAVDLGDAGEIYIARFLPRGKVTDKADQTINNGDDGITWGVTTTGFKDSAYGTSEAFLFGGPGWAALLDEMGFTRAAAGAGAGAGAGSGS